jgi:signal transduction histidine kinase
MTPHPRATVSWQSIVIVGLIVAAGIALAGFIVERIRFGADQAAALERVTRDVQREIERRAGELARVVARILGEPGLAGVLDDRDRGRRALFDRLRRAAADDASGDLAVTIYSADGQVLAWSGRPSTLPAERIAGPPAVFAAPGPLGLRLVHVAPVVLERSGAAARRVGTVAAERVLSPAAGVGTPTPDYRLAASLVPVRLSPGFARGVAREAEAAILIRSPSGEPLVEARVARSALDAARADWRRRVAGLVGLALIAVLLLLGAPLAEWRNRQRTWRGHAAGTLALAVLLVAARGLAWMALPRLGLEESGLGAQPDGGPFLRLLLRSPADWLAHALLAAGLVGLSAGVVQRLRMHWHARRLRLSSPGRWALALAAQAAGGLLAAFLIAGATLAGQLASDRASIDVLHLSVHPFETARLALLLGLLVSYAAAVWAAVLAGVAVQAPFVGPRPGRATRWALLAGQLVAGAALLAGVAAPDGLPLGPMLLTFVAAAVSALAWRPAVAWFRHGSAAQRLVALTLALVLPSLLLYPSLVHLAERSRRRLVAERFAVETVQQPELLQRRLAEARDQIDAIPSLADLVAGTQPAGSRPQTDTAFALWTRTVLATWRLTSSIEIYGPDGRLTSRFAFNLPEYQAQRPTWQGKTCTWNVYGEAAPFGADERRMLHAERGVCGPDGRPVGAVVIHVMLDYASLSFITSSSPYAQLVRAGGGPIREGVAGGDVSLAIYGWGRTPIFTTSGRAWPLDDDLFARIYRTREGFWTTLAAAGARSHVYIANDRNGIYALGYPVLGAFDHAVHLAEIVTLAALGVVLGLLVASGLQRLGWHEPWTGRALLREIRSSFSRKLFLAFVAATIVPVFVLAIVIRTYVAARLRADIEAEAARTAAVAQRVIEETLSLQVDGEISPAVLDDDALVWISRVINQDVNVFDGPQLVATSERDLFASGQLPTRVPDAVYRAIVLDRLPSYVGEDQIGGVRYLQAAAPVSLGDERAILTVPFALRQREIEREIDDLDRGVQLAALAFILLGAGVGYWMAERISDPVQRLTRAARRIAAGDLDARVFVRSADELRRLVDAFNRMAFELQRQRAQLERTQRLEAWAEMARQVAHDIKNPLTPIQLAAEHLERVHRDRGEPLSPVLQSCVGTILAQVRLLRQIAAEFSSFATTPEPRPVPTRLDELVEEVVQAYATGLGGRVAVTRSVDPDLPALALDRTLIGRALTNVIENALHAMPAGGRLDVSVHRTGASVTIAVRDTGVGMDEEAMARIFEPYFSTRATGTGLGLTIARRNVELHGGRIVVESRKGAGTTVQLILPIDAAAAADGARETPKES